MKLFPFLLAPAAPPGAAEKDAAAGWFALLIGSGMPLAEGNGEDRFRHDRDSAMSLKIKVYSDYV
jgi:hypothetical protein